MISQAPHPKHDEMVENPLLSAALDYAALKWPVFPVWWIKNRKCACGKADCQNPGKHPIGRLAPKGRNSATTDPETIHRWWGQYPHANVAIATGPESGLVVVDVDPRNGGDKSFEKLPGIMPITPMVHTGGGGEHYFLSTPATAMKIKSKSEMGGFPGIDQKADGGYVVAPPSNHISGGFYSWKIPPSETYPLAPVPDWLMPLLLKKDDEPRRKPEGQVGDKILDGKRNASLASLAGTMRHRGMSREAIEAALLAENQRCSPPLSKKEVAKIAESIGQYPEGGGEAQGDRKSKPTQAELLIKLAGDAELFHDMNRKGYATIPVDSHMETWPIKSMAFRDWLRGRFYRAQGKPPGGQALHDTLDLLAAQARFDGQEHEVYVRVAHTGSKIYIDLANESWQAIEITFQGWQVVARPPVKFRRPRGIAPMPTPEMGGTLNDLRPFINCRDEDWPLVVAWIIGALSPGPYPIMTLQGEQGTAKSFVAKVLKTLVDPGHAPLRTAPRDVRDLMISAANSWSLSFNNLSGIPPWLSDGLCSLATGGGLSTRELYSDDNETIFDAMRPLILNGIDSLVSRGDLADRAILLQLPRIEKGRRLSEKKLWRAFKAAQPGILGAVFNALSAALANVHGVKLPELPRMADFATWIVAAEPALPWEPGTFLDVYSRNRAAVVEHSLEGDVVAVAVRLLMADREEAWEGAPSGLLEALEALVPESTKRSKAWPKAANSLSNRLRRAATFLRAIGIEIEWGKSGPRFISIRKGMQKTVQTAHSVQTQESSGFALDDPLDDIKGLDDNNVHLDGSQKIPSTRKAKDDNGLDDKDDKDDKKHIFSKACPAPPGKVLHLWKLERQRQAAAKVRQGPALSDDIFSGEEVEL